MWHGAVALDGVLNTAEVFIVSTVETLIFQGVFLGETFLWAVVYHM